MAASRRSERRPATWLVLAGAVLASGCATDYRRDGLSVHEFAAVERVAVYERGESPPLDYQVIDEVEGISCGFSLVPEGHPAYKEVTEYEARYDMKLEAADLGANALVGVDCRRYYRGLTERCNEAILCGAEAVRLDDGVGMDLPAGGTRALAPAGEDEAAQLRYRPPMGFVPDYLTERQRASLGTVGVASPTARPGKTVQAPPTGKRAALQGAGMWALQCIGQGGTVGLIASPLCAAIGASLGALSGESEESIEASTEAIGAVLDEYYHHGALRARVERVARDAAPRPLERQTAPSEHDVGFEHDVDTVVEITVEELLLPAWREGGIVNLPSPVSVRARVRVVKPEGDREIYNRAYGFTSEERRYAEWGAENAAALRQALDEGFEQLAERIVEDLFVAYPLLPGLGARRAGEPRVYVVVPVDPPAHRYAGYRRPAPVRARSLEPRFRWKDFPGRAALRADFQGKLARLSNLRYDLRIYRLDRDRHTARLVHEKRGLTGTEYELAQPLAPATDYAWTVRARFDLDTGERATRWSGDWLGGGVKGFLIRTP